MTPGALCYAAYVRVRYGMPDADAALTYTRSIPEERAAWEAAAEAVLAWEDVRQKHQEERNG